MYEPLLYIMIIWVAVMGRSWELGGGLIVGVLWFISDPAEASINPEAYNSFHIMALIMIGVTTHLLFRGLSLMTRRARENEDSLKELLNQAGEGYLALSDDRVIRHNLKADEILGYKDNGLINKHINELFLDGNTALHSNGNRVDVESFRGEYMFKGKLYQSIFFHDITLRRQGERYRELSHSISQELATERDLARGLRHAVKAIGQEGGWTAVGCWLVDREDGNLYPAAWWTMPGGRYGELTESTWSGGFAPDEGNIGKCLVHGKGEWVYDGSGTRWQELEQAGIRLAVVLPIRAGERILGVLEVLCSSARDYDEVSEQVLTTLAAQMGQFIQREWAESALRSSRALEINDDIVQNLTLAKMYSELDEQDKSIHYLVKALSGAKRIISHLAPGTTPGSLIRRDE
jgi:PAS domain-containing protein